MKVSSMVYCLKQGIINIKRNGIFTLASIGTIASCIFLFGVFHIFINNFQYSLKQASEQVGLSIFFEEDISQDEIEIIGQKIKSSNQVKEIIFISADEAWDNFINKYFGGKQELAEVFKDDNPLVNSASYEIYLYDNDKQDDFVNYLNDIDGIRKVKTANNVVQVFSNMKILLSYISIVIIFILVAVSVFLISMTVTVGISVRKNEISIMKLIGAKEIFIKAPFIIEGIIISLIAVIIPLFILYIIYNNLIIYINHRFALLSGIITFINVNDEFKVLVPISLLIGLGIGYIGSEFTIRKYLKR